MSGKVWCVCGGAHERVYRRVGRMGVYTDGVYIVMQCGMRRIVYNRVKGQNYDPCVYMPIELTNNNTTMTRNNMYIAYILITTMNVCMRVVL